MRQFALDLLGLVLHFVALHGAMQTAIRQIQLRRLAIDVDAMLVLGERPHGDMQRNEQNAHQQHKLDAEANDEEIVVVLEQKRNEPEDDQCGEQDDRDDHHHSALFAHSEIVQELGCFVPDHDDEHNGNEQEEGLDEVAVSPHKLQTVGKRHQDDWQRDAEWQHLSKQEALGAHRLFVEHVPVGLEGHVVGIDVGLPLIALRVQQEMNVKV
mmetsp:Transcript_25260/g.40176  ORF Transcript_25260/g.40176 Transcript_25260/m.40176 type:complete len:211 (+) Transcript_25260:900-1532(+)